MLHNVQYEHKLNTKKWLTVNRLQYNLSIEHYNYRSARTWMNTTRTVNPDLTLWLSKIIKIEQGIEYNMVYEYGFHVCIQ